MALIAAGLVMIIASSINQASGTDDASSINLYLLSILTIGAGIFIWLRRAIKALQRKWAKERNEEITTEENNELMRENSQLKANLEIMQAANHSINHRLRAMENHYIAMIKRLKSYDPLSEISAELTYDLERVLKLKQDYHDALSDEQVDFSLPSTNIKAIDDLFRYFAERFNNEKIEFKLRVAGSIIYMSEKTVTLTELETLIGDFLENALIAIRSNETNARRCVLALIGEANGCYEFAVHDTGIPFDIGTLTFLGTERITTHADTGGSGVGFMKTFAVIRDCKASLIITENKPHTAFTKIVAMRFDDNSKYIIKSYRADEFSEGEGYEVEKLSF